MSQEPEDRPAPANLEAAFAAKGALDLVKAADYCLWRADSIKGVQLGLIRDGHLAAPDPRMVKEHAMYVRMASFFAHVAPIRDAVRELIRAEIVRKKAEDARIDAEIEQRRAERYAPLPGRDAGVRSDEVVEVPDDGPDEDAQPPAEPLPPAPAPEPASAPVKRPNRAPRGRRA